MIFKPRMHTQSHSLSAYIKINQYIFLSVFGALALLSPTLPSLSAFPLSITCIDYKNRLQERIKSITTIKSITNLPLSHSSYLLFLPSPPSPYFTPFLLTFHSFLFALSLRPPSLRSLTLPFLSALPLCLPSLHSLSTSPSSHSDFLFHLFFFTFLLYLPSLPYSSTFLFSCPLCSAFHLSVPLYTSSLCSLSDFTCLSIPVMYIKS